MERQQEWTARAARSYQELARVFSTYLTNKMEQQCDCDIVSEGEVSCQTCPRVARVKQSAYNQMLEGKEALVYQLEETARYFREMEASLKREQYLTEAEKRELISFLRRYHIKAREVETAHRPGKGREISLKLRCDSVKKTMSLRLAERLLSEAVQFPVKASCPGRGYLSEEEQYILFKEIGRAHV